MPDADIGGQQMQIQTPRPHRLRMTVGVSAVAATMLLGGALPAAAADDPVAEPATFTSMFTTSATPDTVIDPDGNPAPGEPGATGTFNFRINSDEEIICWDITLRGVTPPYQSMARTATHIHEADAGMGGPPRLAFPDPEDAGDGTLTSSGCMQGPFTTGIEADGVDTGTDFSLAQIEANPAGFSADTHTANFVPGAVRGQLSPVPMGGVDTGGGGTSGGSDASSTLLMSTVAGLAAAGVGVALMRRRRSAVVS
jgi:hypothetical protein